MLKIKSHLDVPDVLSHATPFRGPSGCAYSIASIEPEILRASDIRGIVGDNLTENTAYSIGRAFGTVIRACSGETICVGYDGRPSSRGLAHALKSGLMHSGIMVFDVGLGPSPMLYYSVHHLGAHGGIMVTGSHNPTEYNGFKIMLGTASFHGEDIQQLGEIARSGAVSNGFGTTIDVDVLPSYVEILAAALKHPSELKVAWDPGNGAAVEVLAELTKRLPGHHLVINGTIDGRFPAHHPDPTVPKNLVQLQDLVASESCDLGIAFDGDGDRIGVVDSTGEILWGDQLLMLLAEPVLNDNPGATIIADVKASDTLFSHIADLGGSPLMWKTGHSFIKSKMIETGAPLAGEMSGHIFFADDYYGFDDALYAAVRLLDVLGTKSTSLSACLRNLPTAFNTPEIRIDCPEHRKHQIISDVRNALEENGVTYNSIDGVRVNTPDGWWLLRQSNTQAVLVARCESSSGPGFGGSQGGH